VFPSVIGRGKKEVDIVFECLKNRRGCVFEGVGGDVGV
jgi:hypothetical protein